MDVDVEMEVTKVMYECGELCVDDRGVVLCVAVSNREELYNMRSPCQTKI